MRGWPFGKAKTPGFGISKSFYHTVLSTKPTMPAIIEVINPQGDGGAVEGFGAPLASTANKDSIQKPMERGAYVIAAKDKKTVLKMLVLSKEEAGFDLDTILKSPLAQSFDDEILMRLRATWTLAQLTFESHDPEVYPAVKFILDLSQRLAVLTDGIVADPISQRYMLPHQMAYDDRANAQIDAREVVAIHFRAHDKGIHAFTLGMQKFVLPELELYGVEPGAEQDAGSFLLTACQSILMGNSVQPGDKVGGTNTPFQVATGGLDKGHWERITCYELLPPTGSSVTQTLQDWKATLS